MLNETLNIRNDRVIFTSTKIISSSSHIFQYLHKKLITFNHMTSVEPEMSLRGILNYIGQQEEETKAFLELRTTPMLEYIASHFWVQNFQ